MSMLRKRPRVACAIPLVSEYERILLCNRGIDKISKGICALNIALPCDTSMIVAFERVRLK